MRKQPPSNTICFVNTNHMWGGGEKWHFEAANYLFNKNMPITFITSKKSELDKRLENKGVPTFHVHAGSLSFLNIFKVFQLYRHFREKKVNTVIINGPADLKLSGLAAYLAQVPNIIYRRGLARPVSRNPLNTFLLKRVISCLLFNSHNTEKVFLQNYANTTFPFTRKLIYNGVEMNLPNDKKDLDRSGSDTSQIILGNASRLVYQKGHDLLIAIGESLARKNMEFKILIAGTGPLENELRNKAASCNIGKHVVFAGFQENIHEFLKPVDIYACTSRFEGFGFSIAEAMLAKKPVIAFDISSNPELVQDKKTGYLINPFDIEAFVEKVVLLQKDKRLRDELGEEGRKFADMNFNHEKQLEKLEVFIREELPQT